MQAFAIIKQFNVIEDGGSGFAINWGQSKPPPV